MTGVDIDGETAREAAERELSKPIYPRPSPKQQFLDFIETARITTAVTTLPAILRGASDWVAYIVDADGHNVEAVCRAPG